MTWENRLLFCGPPVSCVSVTVMTAYKEAYNHYSPGVSPRHFEETLIWILLPHFNRNKKFNRFFLISYKTICQNFSPGCWTQRPTVRERVSVAPTAGEYAHESLRCGKRGPPEGDSHQQGAPYLAPGVGTADQQAHQTQVLFWSHFQLFLYGIQISLATYVVSW